MNAVLVFADGRTDKRADCDASQWWVVKDEARQPHVHRYFRACEVAHTATNHAVEPVGDHVLVYAEQPRHLYEGRLVTA